MGYKAITPQDASIYDGSATVESDLRKVGSRHERALTAAYGRMHGLTFVVPAIGIWTLVAPWLIAGAMDTTRTIWSNVCAGGAIVVFGLVMLAVGFLRVRRPVL